MTALSVSLLWTPDPSGRVRKGQGNSHVWKCLAGVPQFLNSANSLSDHCRWLFRTYECGNVYLCSKLAYIFSA